eukprot:CAMPEP_0117690504 /NCGR_PEP_ID=MMETSP0804-20121206/25163_1 /TAXON_ID=1074897 /ORGANISM="Tetraselmis astigmatica, Strain CCMP880" /LENGTH=988 /DNA_ID=CAMNT_0005503557 /DNA_START=93 /DNA_END=3058 /DNA_ORIENTATION=+
MTHLARARPVPGAGRLGLCLPPSASPTRAQRFGKGPAHLSCSCNGLASCAPDARRVAASAAGPNHSQLSPLEWGKRIHHRESRQAWTPHLEPTGVGWVDSSWVGRQRERLSFGWLKGWHPRLEEQDKGSQSDTCSDSDSEAETNPSGAGDLKHEGSIAPANACYIRRSLNKGERVTHPGTVVVFGDVPEGALVQAGADIIIWGRLYGEARAGNTSASGKKANNKAIICCLEARPTTLSIGDVYKLDVHRTMDPGMPAENGPVLVHFSRDNSINLVMASDRTTKMPHKRRSLLRSNPPLMAAMITGAYISLAGLLLMAAPVTVFGLLFDASKIAAGWIRVFGVICVTFGSYYIGSALGDIRGRDNSFYISTVVGRLFLVVSLCIIVARQELQPSLLILAAVNLLGAFTMWLALRQGEGNETQWKGRGRGGGAPGCASPQAGRTASATAMMHSIWKAAGLLGSHIPPCAAFTLRLTRPVDPFVFSHTRNDMSMELLWLCRDYGLALCSFPPSMLQCFSKSRRVVSTVTQYIMVLGTLRSRGPKPAVEPSYPRLSKHNSCSAGVAADAAKGPLERAAGETQARRVFMTSAGIDISTAAVPAPAPMMQSAYGVASALTGAWSSQHLASMPYVTNSAESCGTSLMRHGARYDSQPVESTSRKAHRKCSTKFPGVVPDCILSRTTSVGSSRQAMMREAEAAERPATHGLLSLHSLPAFPPPLSAVPLRCIPLDTLVSRISAPAKIERYSAPLTTAVRPTGTTPEYRAARAWTRLPLSSTPRRTCQQPKPCVWHRTFNVSRGYVATTLAHSPAPPQIALTARELSLGLQACPLSELVLDRLVTISAAEPTPPVTASAMPTARRLGARARSGREATSELPPGRGVAADGKGNDALRRRACLLVPQLLRSLDCISLALAAGQGALQGFRGRAPWRLSGNEGTRARGRNVGATWGRTRANSADQGSSRGPAAGSWQTAGQCGCVTIELRRQCCPRVSE